jgi:hypothetical protein
LSTIRLTHAPSGTILEEGPKGFGDITPFEGNFYIRWRVALPGNHAEVRVEVLED